MPLKSAGVSCLSGQITQICLRNRFISSSFAESLHMVWSSEVQKLCSVWEMMWLVLFTLDPQCLVTLSVFFQVPPIYKEDASSLDGNSSYSREFSSYSGLVTFWSEKEPSVRGLLCVGQRYFHANSFKLRHGLLRQMRKMRIWNLLIIKDQTGEFHGTQSTYLGTVSPNLKITYCSDTCIPRFVAVQVI